MIIDINNNDLIDDVVTSLFYLSLRCIVIPFARQHHDMNTCIISLLSLVVSEYSLFVLHLAIMALWLHYYIATLLKQCRGGAFLLVTTTT